MIQSHITAAERQSLVVADSAELICPLCKSRNVCSEQKISALLKLNGTDKQVTRCCDCGFRFLNPFLDDAEIENLYNTASNYFDGYVGTPYLEIAAEKLRYYQGIRKGIERRLRRKGTILDIGSATGHFLSVFKQNGWTAQGLEVSDWCRNYAEKEFGIPSSGGTVETASFPKRHFDVISMNHVLEHLRSPLSALRRLHEWLTDDGILCIEVPNEFNDVVFALSGDWGRKRLYNLSGPSLHHQLFFAPKHIRKALALSGFRTVELKTSSWRSPVPCHLFKSKPLNSMAKIARKCALIGGSVLGKGELIFCLARKAST